MSATLSAQCQVQKESLLYLSHKEGKALGYHGLAQAQVKVNKINYSPDQRQTFGASSEGSCR